MNILGEGTTTLPREIAKKKRLWGYFWKIAKTQKKYIEKKTFYVSLEALGA